MRKQKIKGKVFTERKIVNNLLRYYNLCTPEEIEQGKNWYREANEFCRELAETYGVEVWKVAGITAALSPQTSWNQNCQWARQFIQNRGRAFIANRERTIKAKNIYKATDHSGVEDMLGADPTSAKKTKAFYRNILLPGYCDTVTIDRHHLAACLLRPERLRPIDNREAKITHVQYDFLAHCTALVARKVGMVPSECQAAIWLAIRRLRGLQKPVQVQGYQPMDIEDF